MNQPVTPCVQCQIFSNDDTPCARCGNRPTPRPSAPRRRKCKGCGQRLATEASRCERCATKRRPPDHAARLADAQGRIPEEVRTALIARLAAGQRMSTAAPAEGVTPQAVWGLAHMWPEWAAAVDAALMQGRPDDVIHGTSTAYRQCRCPECRQAKNWGSTPRRRL